MLTDERFAYLAEKYIDTVFRVAYGYMKSRADADDVTQDVLIELYKTDKEFDSDSHTKNWLIRVTVNRCKRALRSPWRRAESIDDYAETLGFEAPEYGDLFSAVMRLEQKYRTVVLLYYLEGYSGPEIARLLDVPENTVSTRLARARAKLKDLLTEAYFND